MQQCLMLQAFDALTRAEIYTQLLEDRASPLKGFDYSSARLLAEGLGQCLPMVKVDNSAQSSVIRESLDGLTKAVQITSGLGQKHLWGLFRRGDRQLQLLRQFSTSVGDTTISDFGRLRFQESALADDPEMRRLNVEAASSIVTSGEQLHLDTFLNMISTLGLTSVRMSNWTDRTGLLRLELASLARKDASVCRRKRKRV